VSPGTGVNLDPHWHRDYNFQDNTGLQQQLASGVTLNFNWYRRLLYPANPGHELRRALLRVDTGLYNQSARWREYHVYDQPQAVPVPLFGKPTRQSLVKNVSTGFETLRGCRAMPLVLSAGPSTGTLTVPAP
jgi:hypothetical protein